MKKLLLSTLFIFVMALTACSSNESTETEAPTTLEVTEATDQKETIAPETEQATEAETKEQSGKEVEVIFTALIFDNSQTIEDYVAKLNQDDPDLNAKVYDEDHYSVMMLDSERKEIVNEMYETGIDEAFKEFVTNEQYKGAFTKYEFDKKMENITFTADSAKYSDLGFESFGVIMSTGLIADICQAINLTPVEERKCEIKIIDESGNILYPTN